jgi:hypothetical protein
MSLLQAYQARYLYAAAIESLETALEYPTAAVTARFAKPVALRAAQAMQGHGAPFSDAKGEGGGPRSAPGRKRKPIDLERYYLGMITDEAELARLEEHLLWCHDCIHRAEAAQDHVDVMRVALLRGVRPSQSP